MDERHFMLPCALRRFSVLVVAAVVAALLPGLALAGPASAAEPTRSPSVSLEKTVADSNDPGSAASVGETLTYTFTVTNTGNVALTNLTITDAKLGMSKVPCVSTLAVGATATCPTKTYVATLADTQTGKVSNTATVTASPSLAGLGSGDVCSELESGKVNAGNSGPSFTVTAPQGRLISGYCVKAGSANQGNGPVYVVVDPPKASITMAHPSGKDVSHYALSFAVTDTDYSEIPAPATPGISLQKTVADSNDADAVGGLGETLTYSFSVTNTGHVPLTAVTLTDPKLGLAAVSCVSSLAVGETKSCPAQSYTVTAADIAAGQVHNTATASGKPPTGPNVTDDDDATIATPAKPGLVLDKTVADSADGDSLGGLGETLTYTFKVTNTGNVPLTDVRIDDPKLAMSGVVCTASLAVGASATCTKSYTVTAADVAAGKVLNLATAKGTPPSGPVVSDDDDATIPTFDSHPALALDKQVADSADADDLGSLGEQLTYTLVVTNAGNVPLTDVRVNDPKLGMSNVLCAANLAVGASATCPEQHYTVNQADVLAGKVDNTATAKGTPPSGPQVTDSDDATISTPAEPGLSLQKSVADSADAGDIANLGETLTYTFKVTNTGNVPLSDVRIDDPTLGLADVACVATLAVGATATCPPQSYTVTAADVADGKIHNTATATATPPSGPGQVASDEATITTEVAVPWIFLDKKVVDPDGDGFAEEGEELTYTFTVINTGNVKLTDVTLTDAMLGLADAPCVASLAPGASTNCPLLPAQSYTVTAADLAAGSVANTATVTGTPPSGPPVEDDDDAELPTEDPTPGDAALSIVKTSDVGLAGAGDTVTYTLDVRNSGPGDADDVEVTDVLPAGTTYVESSAPCTYAHPTVTCQLGTIDGGAYRSVTITVKVHPLGASGTTTHQHHLDYTKIEAHVSLFDDETKTVTASCPSGYLATDGSVRLDHVDQGTGTFEDAVVLASGVTADGRGWTGTVRNDATGQVQAKVNVVCATEKTSSGEDHQHPLVITGPETATRTFTAGRHDVDLACEPGSYPVRPSFAFTSGDGVVTTVRTPAGWRFVVDVDDAATATFAIHCLAPALGSASGHGHDLRFEEISDSVSVPAGQVVETRLTCRGDQKGIVSWADLDPGLVPLGTDPQPVTRVFRFYNPTGQALTARFGLLCVDIRTNGGGPKDTTIVNTASVSTSSVDSTSGDDSSSATVVVNPTGVAVSPKATVVSKSGRTSVQLGLATGSKRTVSLKLVSAGKVAGLKGGSVLAQAKATLKPGSGKVRLLAKGAAAKALKNGKVRKAKIVLVAKNGHRDVRVVTLRR